MSRSKGKKHCFPRKGLVTNTHCSKIIQQVLSFQNISQTPRSKAQGKKTLLPMERSCH